MGIETARSADDLEMLLSSEAAETQRLYNELKKAEHKIEEVCRLIGSAQINIKTAQALEHLKRYDVGALTNNIGSRIYSVLDAARKDLDKALDKADRIPF